MSDALGLDAGRCLVIAEVAQAHDGSLGLAHAFIDAVAGAGADVVKFQTHIAHAESTPAEPWRVPFSTQDETRFDYWRRMEFTEAQWRELKSHATAVGLGFISSPFSPEAMDLLERVGVAAWKVASGEIGETELLDRMIASGRPVLLSTGLSDLSEVDRAVHRLRTGGGPFAVLQCTSRYPCPPESVGLNVLQLYRARYECPVGLSDHSGTIFPGLAAAALGAEVVEVHVTLSREMFGPDVVASVTTAELKELVTGVGHITRMRANPVDKSIVAADLQGLRAVFTKSIVARRDLERGAVLSRADLALKKPGTGLPGSRLRDVVGRRLARAVSGDEQIGLADLMP